MTSLLESLDASMFSAVRRAPKVAESRFLLLLLQVNRTESRVKLW
jgi:hypothetical protein